MDLMLSHGMYADYALLSEVFAVEAAAGIQQQHVAARGRSE
jgi:hypothetical protein